MILVTTTTLGPKIKYPALRCVTVDPSGRAVSGEGLRLLACWDCGFEPCRGHRCLSLVKCVARKESLCRAGHSSRGVLPNGGCLSVIVKPRKLGCSGPLGGLLRYGREAIRTSQTAGLQYCICSCSQHKRPKQCNDVMPNSLARGITTYFKRSTFFSTSSLKG